jgi:acetyl-CoA carboxylase carboxyltransferase component
MRCAIIEAETREEVMREMEERMRNMEVMYSRRLMTEVSAPKHTHTSIKVCRAAVGAKRVEDRCKDRHVASSWVLRQP